jgi:hypothetical protein
MEQKARKKIGEVRVKTYLKKNDNSLLRLEEAKIRKCTVSEDEAKGRDCTELGDVKSRECEELVLVYRLSGCVREKNEVDLNETTLVGAESADIKK